jgi:hypothetical protein
MEIYPWDSCLTREHAQIDHVINFYYYYKSMYLCKSMIDTLEANSMD